MKFIEVLQKTLIQEATEYDKMFANEAFFGLDTQINQTINWARKILKKSDRIVWYLRLYRLYLLKTIGDRKASSGDMSVQNIFNKDFENYKKKAGKEPGFTSINRTLQLNLEHFMSLDIPEIKNFNFGWLNPQELLRQFEAFEDKYKEQKDAEASLIPDDAEPNKTVLIKFPDGFVWFNLNCSSSKIEAAAMGHCGNAATNGRTQTVLSLRKPVKVGTDIMWQPCLTFILDKADGSLGEMKGRGNDKPHEKYHPYIIELLENDIVHSIAGGGYLPENNFDIIDLPEEEQDRLIELKPFLGGPILLFKKFGDCKVVRKSIEVSSKSFGVPIIWSDEQKGFIIETWPNLSSLIKDKGNDVAKYVSDIIIDGEYLEINDSDYTDACENLYTDLPTNLQLKIDNYAWNNYRDDFDEDYVDALSLDSIEVIRCLENNSDILFELLSSAVDDGRRSGAEKQMMKSLKDACIENNFSFSGNFYDDPVSYVLTTAEVIRIVKSDVEYGWDLVSCSDEINIDEPNYGWDGYDKKDAIERFNELLGENSENINWGENNG